MRQPFFRMPNPISGRQLERLFPHASKSCREMNSVFGSGIPEPARPTKIPTPSKQPDPRKSISITITGQIRGGKNNMIVTRNGKHIPKQEWASWRDGRVQEVLSQLPENWEPINTPTNVQIDYISGDLRRRDFPAICDSVWHILEKAGFVSDDTLLWPARSTKGYDRKNPRLTITTLC